VTVLETGIPRCGGCVWWGIAPFPQSPQSLFHNSFTPFLEHEVTAWPRRPRSLSTSGKMSFWEDGSPRLGKGCHPFQPQFLHFAWTRQLCQVRINLMLSPGGPPLRVPRDIRVSAHLGSGAPRRFFEVPPFRSQGNRDLDRGK
jgi:hypothetical protein